MCRRLLGAACLAVCLGLPACSSEPLAGRSANVVFLTEPGCDFFVVQSLGRAYAVFARQSDEIAPAQGDVFEGGALRRGRATFRFLPLGADDAREQAREVTVEVDRPSVGVVEAQARLAEACAAEA